MWTGNLQATGTTVGEWTPSLLTGLEGRTVNFAVRPTQDDKYHGEIWIRTRPPAVVYIITFILIARLLVW